MSSAPSLFQEVLRQLVLRLGDSEWIETLAQMPGLIPHLPTEAHLDAPLPGLGAYEIRCTLTEHSERGLEQKRRGECERSDTGEHGLLPCV